MAIACHSPTGKPLTAINCCSFGGPPECNGGHTEGTWLAKCWTIVHVAKYYIPQLATKTSHLIDTCCKDHASESSRGDQSSLLWHLLQIIGGLIRSKSSKHGSSIWKTKMCKNFKTHWRLLKFTSSKNAGTDHACRHIHTADLHRT